METERQVDNVDLVLTQTGTIKNNFIGPPLPIVSMSLTHNKSIDKMASSVTYANGVVEVNTFVCEFNSGLSANEIA